MLKIHHLIHLATIMFFLKSYADSRYLRIISGSFNMNNNKITNLADPQSDKDAVNKQ